MAEILNQFEAKASSKRRWMYPMVRKGRFYKWRSQLSYVYLAVFFCGLFLRVGGNPLLMLNFPERQFFILGQGFWPQDIFLFMLASLAGLVSVVLFTIAFGRIFCGWICPQTIFMEMVFRKIEIGIEGDAGKRKKLDASPWTLKKVRIKATKHIIFILLSFLIANTFLAYIIGSTHLLKIITEPVNEHWSGFISIWIFTAVFYLVYTQVRELVCTVICPYGRLQGVMLDKDTLVVAYNEVRGEPRGKISKTADVFTVGKGDCIDCGLCVNVCPTGIDIRKGTQMECINCTACIDACDQVMEKIGRPRSLIGYYSENMIRENKRPSFNKRMAAYSSVIILLLSVLSYFVFTRSDIDATIMRSAGLLYQEQPGEYISNIYNVELINKSNTQKQVNIQPNDPGMKIKYIQAPGAISQGSSVKATFFLLIPANKLHQAKTDVYLKITAGNKVMQTLSTSFVGPVND